MIPIFLSSASYMCCSIASISHVFAWLVTFSVFPMFAGQYLQQWVPCIFPINIPKYSYISPGMSRFMVAESSHICVYPPFLIFLSTNCRFSMSSVITIDWVAQSTMPCPSMPIHTHPYPSISIHIPYQVSQHQLINSKYYCILLPYSIYHHISISSYQVNISKLHHY